MPQVTWFGVVGTLKLGLIYCSSAVKADQSQPGMTYLCTMAILQKGNLRVIDLGLIDYKEAWDLQTTIHRQLIENKRAGYPVQQDHYLLLCEHTPVFTLGKSGSEAHLKIDDEALV